MQAIKHTADIEGSIENRSLKLIERLRRAGCCDEAIVDELKVRTWLTQEAAWKLVLGE